MLPRLRSLLTIRLCAAIGLSLMLSACAGAGDGPKVDAGPSAEAEPPVTLPEGTRGVALRVAVLNDAGDLAEPGAEGYLYVARDRDQDVSFRLAYQNGALALYGLEPGVYRIVAIDGFDCGPISFRVKPFAAPLALGSIEIKDYAAAAPRLRRAIPTGAEIDEIGRRLNTQADDIEARPIEIRSGSGCKRFNPFKRWRRYDPELEKLRQRQAIISAAALAVAVPLLVIFPPAVVVYESGLLFLGF